MSTKTDYNLLNIFQPPIILDNHILMLSGLIFYQSLVYNKRKILKDRCYTIFQRAISLEGVLSIGG